MTIIGVIPARFKSSRFPGKPLADICGKPMIWWVYQQCKKVDDFDEVYVATDDDKIFDTCKSLGIEVIMTSEEHRTGTDRIGEVARKIPADLIVNIQGDEPLLEPIDGIRLAFHKKDMPAALELFGKIKAKGYKVFIQAMVSLNYNDEEFLDLIRRVNNLEPYSFYIVDSFGVMKKKDLIRLFYMVEHNLKKSIAIGYHSHNNMQLAYSNAQALVDMRTEHDLIIDSSIFGMGRGAGNLNTELFVEYLNDNLGCEYKLKPLLNIIDDILNDFYQRNYWGYSLPNYLSAKHNTHPNYAGYLDGKKTLTVEAMDEIFSLMDDSKRVEFDKGYMEELYTKYMAKGSVQESHLSELKKKFTGKNVLVIAPGKSSVEEKDKVVAFAKRDDTVSISINFDYSMYNTDFIFLSNLRRFRDLDPDMHDKCIVTSNIPAVDVYLQTKYGELLNDENAVHDNAGMMLIRFLINMGVKKIYLAGMDGYSVDPMQNYVDQSMTFYTQRAITDSMNDGINSMLRKFSKEITIDFITEPRYVNIREK